MSRGSVNSRQALMAALSGINGGQGGYYHDLQTRVFDRLILPEVEPGVLREGPYLTVPGIETEQSVESESSGLGVMTQTTYTVYGFVAETSAAVRQSAGPIACAKLIDDVKRALLLSHSLQNEVLSTRMSWEMSAGIAASGQGTYGEVAFRVVIVQYAGADDLGSAA